jgi:hypothetical protein
MTNPATNSVSTDLLKRFYQALPDSAQGGADETAFYVNRANNSAYDQVANLKGLLDWAATGGNGSTYLFSGLRGSGKTTEINRLLWELREDNVAAYYCDASVYLNLNDPEITLPDLLMTALAGLADDVRKQHGRDCLSQSFWERTKTVMNSKVELKPKFNVALGGGDLEFTLQDNPAFKESLNKFARESNTFYDEAQKFTLEVVQSIRAKTGHQRIVLVVDALERLTAPPGDENKLFNSLKEIYFNQPARLQLPDIAIIYTAPPYLQAILPNVESGFAQCLALANFNVMHRPTAGNPPGNAPARNQDGIGKMLEILNKRFPEWQQVMAPAVAEHLAWLSGGNVRRYFDLLRNSVFFARTAPQLPMAVPDEEPVRHAIAKAQEALQWLNKSDRVWLERFKTGLPGGEVDKMQEDLANIIRLFDHSLVLNYQNGEIWYNVAPLVREHV